MKTLLWKDYRVNRQVLIVGLVLLIAPHLLSIGIMLRDTGLHNAARGNPQPRILWSPACLWGASCSVMLSLLTVALLGGNVIAGERVDRSAEFLAYLPPSRRAIIASKALLTALACLAMWGLNLPIMLVASPDGVTMATLEKLAAPLAGTTLLLLGVSWMCSSFLSRPAIAACIGIAATVSVAATTARMATVWQLDKQQAIRGYAWIALILGLLCFAVGTLYYIRRVEP